MNAKSRVEKIREKRLKRKEKRKAILAGVEATIQHEGVSGNWETLKAKMGIKERPKVVTAANIEERVKDHTKITKVIALDCEMVGVGPGGKEHMLARVSIVNLHGHVIYDSYVRPQEKVVDYRTNISGIRPENLEDAAKLTDVQKMVADLMKDRILVGHDLRHDFDVLFLSHPNRQTRDTSLYRPFREMFGGRTPSLKNLALRILELNIQDKEHSSIQDAQVAMKLYLKYQRQWEDDVKKRTNRLKRKEMLRHEKQSALKIEIEAKA